MQSRGTRSVRGKTSSKNPRRRGPAPKPRPPRARRKNFILDQDKLDRARALTGTDTDQAAIEQVLDTFVSDREADAEIRSAIGDWFDLLDAEPPPSRSGR